MENAIQIKNGALAGVSALGGWLLSAFGGWDVTLQALVGFMAVDYITGLIVAGVFHRSNKTATGGLGSNAGFKGLARKAAVLGLVFVAVLLDRETGAGFIRPAVCLFFTANEGISILENLGLMGVPYPRFLKDMLEVLKKRSDTAPDSGKGENQP